VRVEILVEPDVTDTNPGHGRKVRAKLTLTVPNKDGNYAYKVSVTNVCLFDPIDEMSLNEPSAAKVENVPLDKDRVTFNVELGSGL
jgi:hypothetical protein